MFRKTIQTLVLAGLLAVTGCASGSGGAEPSGDLTIAERLDSRVAIQVRNDLIPRTAVILKVRAPGRPVKALGTILSDQTQTFVLETRHIAAGYVLIAERPGRRPDMVTRRISVISRAKITWDLGVDIVRIERL